VTFNSFGWQGRDRRLSLADTIAVIREGQSFDLLATDNDLQRWLDAEASWLGPVRPDEAPALSDVHRLRAATRDLLFALVRGEGMPSAAAAIVNDNAAASPSYRRLDLSAAGAPRAVHESGGARPSQVLALIADATIDLLAGPDAQRLRVCPAPSCGMFFIAGKAVQQWCSTSCGNRARVARHYQRSRAGLFQGGKTV
jgi:predicted RNA-binding Zn ribbon-like protein